MRRNFGTYIALIGMMLAALFFVACSSDAGSDADADHDDTAADHDEEAGHDDDADMDMAGDALFDTDAHETISLELKDIAFGQTEISIPVGEVVELELSNTGAITHDFTIEKIDAVFGVHGDHDPVAGHDEHGDALAVHHPLEAGDAAEARIQVHEAGTYEFFCTVPGHKEAGMVGTLTVTE